MKKYLVDIDFGAAMAYECEVYIAADVDAREAQWLAIDRAQKKRIAAEEELNVELRERIQELSTAAFQYASDAAAKGDKARLEAGGMADEIKELREALTEIAAYQGELEYNAAQMRELARTALAE